jgi:predicted phosphodiesterase
MGMGACEIMHSLMALSTIWLLNLLSLAHPKVELTTVADDYAVFFERRKGKPVERVVVDGLVPGHKYNFQGKHFRTLNRPSGKLLSTFATVNDIHIGEIICGFDSKHPKRGPILKNEPGKMPYAEMMSRNAVEEILATKPDAVLVKGDITDAGKPEDFSKFFEIWGRFGSKLHWVCGNHDVHFQRPSAAEEMVRVDLPGVILAMLDTSILQQATGRVSAEQLAWLDDICKTADRPVLVFGHHHLWTSSEKNNPHYFGIDPADSEKLVALFRKHKCLVGYFCGHTHSSRIMMFPPTSRH